MIRFIDLTEQYPPEYDGIGYRRCAFIDTEEDSFIEDDCGCHTFIDMGEISCIPDPEVREKCKQVIPEGFFGRKDKS